MNSYTKKIIFILSLTISTATPTLVNAKSFKEKVCEGYSQNYNPTSYKDGQTGAWLGTLLGKVVFGCWKSR
ncbi:hypothetical protein F9K94_22410 [Brucella tritici]|uniref:Uncharacterized protein n=1 Tax=Brucella tritici TaxID=94626 RepID=A0A7V7VQX9_9HYPH|nr:hypothetical protein [Brucella tritici]KAB2655013.1 hypothetical protein F9K94_22410 [Brucella tritici]